MTVVAFVALVSGALGVEGCAKRATSHHVDEGAEAAADPQKQADRAPQPKESAAATEGKSDGKLIVGMNFTNPQKLSVAEQDTMIAQMKAAGVKVVRCGASADDAGMDLLRRIYAAGMKVDLEVSWVYPKDAPRRPFQPDKFPGMWAEVPLSYANVEQSRASYQTVLGLLDTHHIVPVAFEMGNEINWTGFNGEFPLPGKGIIFNYEQLSSDPEGRQIAKGYERYVELLKALQRGA
jgi:hypothetical protein